MIAGRLISLGPILPVDFQSLYRWADDFETSLLNEPYRPPDWKTHQDFWLNNGNNQSRVFFAIRRLVSAGEIIGFIQITNIDLIHRSALIGVRIGDEVNRGKGFGTEAIKLAMDYCWRQLNLSRLSLNVFETNEKAIKLYSALGFEREGVLRRAVFINGGWLDLILMGFVHPSRVDPQRI